MIEKRKPHLITSFDGQKFMKMGNTTTLFQSQIQWIQATRDHFNGYLRTSTWVRRGISVTETCTPKTIICKRYPYRQQLKNLTACLKYSAGLCHIWAWEYSRLNANSTNLQLKRMIYTNARGLYRTHQSKRPGRPNYLGRELPVP